MTKLFDKNKIFCVVAVHFILLLTLHTFQDCYYSLFYKIPFYKNIHTVFDIPRWLIWVIPSIMLIKIFEKDMAVSFSELFTNKLNWRIFWNINAVFLLYFLMRWLYYINFQADKLSTYPNIKTFLIQFVNSFWLTSNQAGFPEEMVFRAWIQNSLMSKIKIKNAIILSNILFVIIHIPSFILYYKYTNFWSCFYHSIGVFVFGSIFGILFAKTKNILAPVFFHTILDVFAVMVLKS